MLYFQICAILFVSVILTWKMKSKDGINKKMPQIKSIANDLYIRKKLYFQYITFPV